ncbi:hypothetical protein [Lysinibacillus xylanilyticus]|uniref:hypothetical protein n=1 Tax=Lysinibacillus xylanilyticus TaxID=582475 RepID=UPI00380725D5
MTNKKGNEVMSKEFTYSTMQLSFVTEGMTPVELMVYFNDFLKVHTHLVSQSGRTTPVEIVESHFTSICTIDDDENEREFIDKGGKLKLTEQEIREAIKKKIH